MQVQQRRPIFPGQAGPTKGRSKPHAKSVRLGVIVEEVALEEVHEDAGAGSVTGGSDSSWSEAKQVAAADPTYTNAVQAILDGRMQDAERILDMHPHIDKALYHSMIHRCGKAGNIQAALWCIERMSKHSMKPGIATFNSLLSACGRAGNLKVCSEWFQFICRLGIKPNRVTYNIMIQASVEAGNMAVAQQWIDLMLRNGFEPCTMTYSIIINAFRKTGDVEKAESWFVTMTASGVRADKGLYNALLNVCAVAKRGDRAENWMNRMRTSGIVPDAKSFASLVASCATAGNCHRAEQHLEEMLRYHKPDETTYQQVIQAFEEAGLPCKAECWARRLQGKSEKEEEKREMKGLESEIPARTAVPLTRTDVQGALDQLITAEYNLIIKGFASRGDLASAQGTVHDMMQQGAHPDEMTLVFFLQCAQAAPAKAQLTKWFYATILQKYVEFENAERISYWASMMGLMSAEREGPAHSAKPQPWTASSTPASVVLSF